MEKGGSMNINYGLLAISGDCSARGMSDKADFIRIPNNHLNLVKKYLRNVPRVTLLLKVEKTILVQLCKMLLEEKLV